MELTLDQALQKGIEAHKSGKVEEADKYYTAILKIQPNHPDANHNMGVLAVGVGKVEQALPFFKTALEVNTNIAQYWLSYIDALIQLGRIADAKAVFEQAKSNGAKGDVFDQLEKKLGSSAAKNSNNQEPPDDQMNALINLYNQNRLQQALNEAQMLTKQYPKSLTLWNLMGSSATQLGKLDEAITAFQSAISLNPNHANAYYNMGVVLQNLGQHEKAIDKYKKALSIKPDSHEAYYNIGIALKDLGQLDNAINAFRKGLSIKPDYAEAYNNKGIALQGLDKLEESVRAYQRALSIKPDYAEAYNNMGTALQEQDKLEEAMGAFDKALSIKPDYAEVILNASALINQLADTAFLDEELNERLDLQSFDLIEMPEFQIQRAIKAFLLSNQELVRKHLNIYKSCPPSSIAKLEQRDQVFCSAYNHFLEKLIETPFETEPTSADHQTAFHIGDSHCFSYAHKLIKINGIDYNIVPRITFGGKAFHFSIKKMNAFKAITKANFNSLPDASIVFLSFGEIDCRPNEGFISTAKKHKKQIEDLVSDTVRGYVDWFAEQNQSKNHSLFFFNVPAPIYNEKFSKEVNVKVIRTIKLFNNLLHKNVLDNDFNVIDVYKFTAGKEGVSNSLFHIDDYHLSSKAIPEIEKQISTFS